MRMFAAFGAACVAVMVSVSAFAQGPLPADVTATKLGHGWRLADAKGMTLYIYESDEKGTGKSKCNVACAKAWPPLIAAEGAAPQGAWSIITRDDGGHQWAFKGKPVYRYAREGYPGGTFGDGGSWAVAFQPIPLPPGVATGKTLRGEVLTSANGMTLYTRTDKAGADPKSCNDVCLETWMPAVAPWMAGPIGDFTAIAREDGVSQWAYKGALLYSYAQDAKPGDTKGEGIDKAWHATVLEPTAPVPGWVTVVASDGGDLFADAKGMTIYAYDEDRNKLVVARGEDCFGECITSSWDPVPATEQAAPIGNWSVIKTEAGFQWAYQGKPLYTSKAETRPGDLSGIMLRRSRAWRPLMLTLPSIQGASPNG